LNRRDAETAEQNPFELAADERKSTQINRFKQRKTFHYP